MNEPLVVVDTSIHVASEAFSKKGSPSREVIARGAGNHFKFAVSELLLREIAEQLVGNGVDPELVAEYLANLRVIASHFDDREDECVVCADPDDVFVMVLARTAEAWCIVSYDHALVDENATPPGWSIGAFLGRLRERRGEPPRTPFPI